MKKIFIGMIIGLVLFGCSAVGKKEEKIQLVNVDKNTSYIYVILFKTKNENIEKILDEKINVYFSNKSNGGITKKDTIKTEILRDMKDVDIISPEYIKTFGKGIEKLDLEKITKFDTAIEVNVNIKNTDIYENLKAITKLSIELANTFDGVIYDDETREVFSKDYFKKYRVDNWNELMPNVTNQITVHFYKNGKYYREVTLGMKKFGLPEIAINDITSSSSKSINSIINLICQYLIEKNEVYANKKFEIKIDDIKNENLKKSLKEKIYENAKLKSNIKLVFSTPEEGDAENRLLILDCDKNIQEYQENLISELFGTKDEIVYVKHEEELLNASKEAKKQLPRLKDVIGKSLKPNEYILVKLPFKTPSGGNEWMWVEVSEWKEKRISGILQNDAFEIPNLKSGKKVEGNEDDVFDYIHYLPDGTQEGNETGKIIEKLNQN